MCEATATALLRDPSRGAVTAQRRPPPTAPWTAGWLYAVWACRRRSQPVPPLQAPAGRELWAAAADGGRRRRLMASGGWRRLQISRDSGDGPGSRRWGQHGGALDPTAAGVTRLAPMARHVRGCHCLPMRISSWNCKGCVQSSRRPTLKCWVSTSFESTCWGLLDLESGPRYQAVGAHGSPPPFAFGRRKSRTLTRIRRTDRAV